MKLLIAAGGTGGHIFPGISVAEAFMEVKGNEVFFTGTPYGLEEKLVPGYGFRLIKIEAKPFLGGSPAAKAKTMVAVLRGFFQARTVIKRERPDGVLGMGGFTSVPVVLSALQLGVPCFIHEQNVFPGMANRLLARKAVTTFISFEPSTRYLKAKDIVRAGNPIRKVLRGKPVKNQGSTFSIFVFGGSRGARSINEGILALLPYLDPMKEIMIYHQTGSEDFERVKEGYRSCRIGHEVFPFTDEMGKYYNLADLVISRAGASTIFELAYFGKPAILIPYPFSAGDHQWKNAAYVQGLDGSHVIRNNELTGERLYTTIMQLREDPGQLARMGENIRSIYVDNAEEIIIRGIQAGVVSQN
jgi:UDP-N-acetylglucosamine--N-acetylmuramyl-(pentapeptide) pyrophosphoryl-undecaprenol N-acetylglucosamine transferase